MKIIINALSARQGGGQTYIKHLLENFPKNGNSEAVVVVPKSLKLQIDTFNIKKLNTQIETKNLSREQLVTQRDIIRTQLNKKLANKNKVFSQNSIDELRLSLSLKEEKLIENKELINSLSIQIETYKEEVEKINNTISRLNNDLKETKVVAPYSGHISLLNIEVGKEVSSNEVLAELSSADGLEVKFSIGGIDYYKLSKFANKVSPGSEN